MLDWILWLAADALMALANLAEPDVRHSVTIMVGHDSRESSPEFCVHHDLCISIDNDMRCTPAKACEK